MRVEPVPGQFGDLLAQAGGEPDVLIYVHGFRQTFETAVLDAARLSDGIKFRGATMVFSWPSKAGFFDYAYDRESAVWSRDAFERVLASVMANPDQRPRAHRRPQHGHHAGARKPAPALWRAMATRPRTGSAPWCSRRRTSTSTSSRRRSQRIGPIARKITVITATNDRALALSSRVAGGITRVGAAEKAALERLGLRVVDASGLGWGIINHDLFLSNDDVRRLIRRAVDESRGMAG